MIDLAKSVNGLKAQYDREIQRIADNMLAHRNDDDYVDADDADDHLNDLVTASDWADGERYSALTLYCASVSDIADYVLEWGDLDMDNPLTQRAELAITYDVYKILWTHGWEAIGRQYRDIKFEDGKTDENPRIIRRSSPIEAVIEHGFEVCDHLEADKNELTNPRLSEVKLLLALRRLQRAIEASEETE